MHELVETAAKAPRHLTEAEAYELLSAYGFTAPAWRVVSSFGEAVEAAFSFSPPLEGRPSSLPTRLWNAASRCLTCRRSFTRACGRSCLSTSSSETHLT